MARAVRRSGLTPGALRVTLRLAARKRSRLASGGALLSLQLSPQRLVLVLQSLHPLAQPAVLLFQFLDPLPTFIALLNEVATFV